MRRLLYSFFILVALYLLLVVRARPVDPHPFYANLPDRPLNIAHQGGEHLRPSNTMIAFEHGLATGADVLEMDIHSSADGVLVTIHDNTVDRTTDGSGRVNELTLEQIKSLDAGYYWSADGGATHPYRSQGVTIATLNEVFAAFPDVPMVIEIKQSEPPIVEPFCAMIRVSGKAQQVLVASFSQTVIDDFRATCPEVATSAAQSDVLRFYVLQFLRLQRISSPTYEAFQVPEYFAGIRVLAPHFVRSAEQRGVRVEVWTINESAEMRRFLDLGVDGVITDRPDLLQGLLQNGGR